MDFNGGNPYKRPFQAALLIAFVLGGLAAAAVVFGLR